MNNILNNRPILKKALNASTWSALTAAASKAITPIVFIVLARMLTPKDYGMVAIATMIISFSRVFWEAGLNLALIQSREKIREVANIVFFTNIVLSWIVFCIIYAFAPLFASLFKEPNAVSVIRVQSFVIVINAFCAVQNSLLQKELKFKQLFYVGLIGTMIPGLVSIGAASIGLGYWALVWGTLTGAFAQLILLWIVNPWRPTFSYNLQVARKILTFGLWSAGESLLAWGQAWIDSIIVAAYLGTADLGLYRTGNMFIQSLFYLMLSPILPVLFSTMSLKSDDRNFISISYDKATRWLSVLSLSTGFILFSLQGPISLVFFGGKWSGISLVMGLLALEQAIGWMFGANMELFKAIGRPNICLYSSLIYLPVSILGCFVSIKYGLFVFLITRVSIFIGGCFIIHPILLYRVIQYKFIRFIHQVWWAVVCACICSLVAFFVSRINFYQNKQILATIIAVSCGAIVYTFLIIKKHDYRADLMQILKSITGRAYLK